MSNETIIPCFDAKDFEERRAKVKKHVKKNGVFMRCEGNSILLTDGSKITFKIDDEHLPAGAFYDPIAEQAAKDMIE